MTKDNLFGDAKENTSNFLNKDNSKRGRLPNFLYDGLSSLVPGTGELYNTLYSNSEEEKKFE